VLEALNAKGASFFKDLQAACGLDSEDTRLGLGALVALGLASSDGFSGLRALLAGRPATYDRRATFAGRWSAIPTSAAGSERSAAIEIQAWALLRRYGVVFRRLLTRESIAAPWRDLARAMRRLEARGEIRGGRFVSGMSGEQFALPEAVERLREVRRMPVDGRIVSVGTADPLNLAGIITSGERVRTASRNRIAYRDGIPLAVLEGDEIRPLVTSIDPATLDEVTAALRVRRAPARA
jgi:ATP-dependent Lhr-like helicase